jgi:hypothetical protein
MSGQGEVGGKDDPEVSLWKTGQMLMLLPKTIFLEKRF